jgi:hypothetical protein
LTLVNFPERFFASTWGEYPLCFGSRGLPRTDMRELRGARH